MSMYSFYLSFLTIFFFYLQTTYILSDVNCFALTFSFRSYVWTWGDEQTIRLQKFSREKKNHSIKLTTTKKWYIKQNPSNATKKNQIQKKKKIKESNKTK